MDYANEPHGVFFLIDIKSFYASVECVQRHENPLRTPLVVMSEAANTNGGLILATSPMAKKLFHVSNVSRVRDVPEDNRLIVVPPRMNLYIEQNLIINNIFRQFVTDQDLYPYSIDESILDMTHSWHLFGQTHREAALAVQHMVLQRTGLYTSIGIGETPVQAKIALDVYAKHDPDFIDEMTYQTVPKLIWPIKDLTEVWGIGRRTAAHLNRLGIYSMDDLAHTDPYWLKEEMGVIGTQLFAVAWGIDRSKLSQRIKVREPSLGNSQVLPRDYHRQEEIELVLRELANQVASRVRRHGKQARRVSLSIGFAYAAEGERGGFSHTVTIPQTNSNREIAETVITMFRKYWEREPVRNVAVSCGQLAADSGQQLDLLDGGIEQQIKRDNYDRVTDAIRQRFGTTALVMASSLLKGGTMIERASLVGGHNGGNSYE
ncbi:possible DNA-directed DNA polymerase [Secundilactobacillus oryzae JCM 18671]|uniref:Possible DNA-directed DNA polymerase n=1 Tax=Secundilactobacillus oryzae JCM 18671 TaxID=1291743 RepID=A0A081BHW1_9LACO|nr:Y-family DNA polymerase [Secundilactobacillus oryzae]GAK47629.1 possible DNA-directed DNA polymerase [Secundilactobacillus oryzae JCM 18671]